MTPTLSSPGAQPQRIRRQADTSRGTGVAPGRLFAVDVGALREIPLPALVVRFAFGATISVVAGLIGVLAGKAAGGVMLAAPAVLPATLTIVERHEGRGPAVTEVEGAVPGAVALIGFAGVAAASTARIPLGAALLGALATEKQDLAVRPEHPAQFAQRPRLVVHPAQHQRGDHGIERAVLERQILGRSARHVCG
jgi:hypothetical protein